MEVRLQVLQAADQVVVNVPRIENASLILGRRAKETSEAFPTGTNKLGVFRRDGWGTVIPEGSVHVVNVNPRELPGKFRGRELLELLEHLVLGLVLSVVACSID